jgi:hypothetical protein
VISLSVKYSITSEWGQGPFEALASGAGLFLPNRRLGAREYVMATHKPRVDADEVGDSIPFPVNMYIQLQYFLHSHHMSYGILQVHEHNFDFG